MDSGSMDFMGEVGAIGEEGEDGFFFLDEVDSGLLRRRILKKFKTTAVFVFLGGARYDCVMNLLIKTKVEAFPGTSVKKSVGEVAIGE
ncbi:hypothetical protein KI387_025367, partial [Taxus chinensis]